MFDAIPTVRETLDAAYDEGAAMARTGKAGTVAAVRAARAAGYGEFSTTFKQFCAGYLDTLDRR